MRTEPVRRPRSLFAAPLVAALLLPGLLYATIPDDLPDQYGNPVSMEAFKGQPFIVIVASGRKLRHIQGWEEGLRESYPQLNSARVADITDTPRPSHAQVAEKLRKRAPEGVSIMIDLENRWATAFGLDTDEPCVLIFGSDGELLGQFRGRANKARLAEVSTALASVAPGDAS